MLSNFLNILLRISGLAITLLLLIQPWFLATNTTDPFLYSGWSQIFAGFFSLFVTSLLLAFYRPKKGYITQISGLLILFLAISLSLYFTHYTVAFRHSLLSMGLLASLGALRLLRKDKDNFSIAGMISLSGFFMAIYAICHASGQDFLTWESKSKIVGTLTNLNFLGLFLCMTSAVTFGLFAELHSLSKKHSFTFLAFFITQISVILMLNLDGHLLCLGVMAVIWAWSKHFKFSGRISRRPPVIAGFIVSLVLILCQWIVYDITSKYPWEKLTKVPNNSETLVSRLILWQMGLEIFTRHPYTGAGAGAVAYIMPLERPPTASALGLKIYNDDPHSFVVTALAETGLLGLLGLCTLAASIYGCYVRKNEKWEEAEGGETKEEEEGIKGKETAKEGVRFPWLYTSIAVFILYLSFQSGFVQYNYLPIAITSIIAFFGLCTSFGNSSYKATQSSYRDIGRGTLTAIFTFAFYSLFNNAFSILPLIGFLTMIASLHYSCCQPNVVWKPRITVVSLLFLFLPVIYGFSASHFQLSYQREESLLSQGLEAMEKENFQEAEKAFHRVIGMNFQNLRAYHGLAKALYAQKKNNEAKEIFNKLDTMVPNIFNVKYDIARILFEDKQILDAHRIAIKNLEWARTPIAYEMLGNILLEERRYNEAEETFKDGLICIPANAEERIAADRMRLSLAALYSNKGDLKNSKIYINAIKSEVSSELEALYIKGMILINEKKYKEALATFEDALKLYPQVPTILNAVGYLLTITGKDLDRAQILLENAYITLKEGEARNLSDLLMIANSLGKLYQKQNKNKEAGELLKFSYENTPDEWVSLKKERLEALNSFYESLVTAVENR